MKQAAIRTTGFFLGLFLLFVAHVNGQETFRTQQMKFPRVRVAFASHEPHVLSRLKELKVNPGKMDLFIRVFKKEARLELWVKNKTDKAFLKFRDYEICASSGGPGPKRKAGDGQVPEGVYHIDRFNPSSSYHLSLGVSYPNRSDRILSPYRDLGGDIFIHGRCVTIGCMPMTDDRIEEIYCLAVMAKSNGQQKIPVHIFPTELTWGNYDKLKKEYAKDRKLLDFWHDLTAIYQYFDTDHVLPASITVNPNGEYKAEPKKVK